MKSEPTTASLVEVLGGSDTENCEAGVAIDEIEAQTPSDQLQACDAPTLDTGRAEDSPPEFLTFSVFPNLPAELRLQVWDEALQKLTREPRVINIFVKCHKKKLQEPSRLTVLNFDSLRQADVVGNLLGTSYEARTIAQAYLDLHPPNDIGPGSLQWRSRRAQKWMCLFRLGQRLRYLRIDPARDVLFLNGLDLDASNSFRPPDMNDALLLPKWLRGSEIDWHLCSGKHTRALEEDEGEFTRLFRTIIMPVHGLVEQGRPEAVFNRPLTVSAWWRDWHEEIMADKTFIALVGQYRGRNLQMADLEFIPNEEIERIRGEVHERWAEGMSQLKVTNILYRDVILMTAIWSLWRDSRMTTNGPTLRFARVKEQVLDRLTHADIYVGEM
jgi:hypothetical protein